VRAVVAPVVERMRMRVTMEIRVVGMMRVMRMMAEQAALLQMTAQFWVGVRRAAVRLAKDGLLELLL